MGPKHVRLSTAFTRIRDAVAALPVDSAVLDARPSCCAPIIRLISKAYALARGQSEAILVTYDVLEVEGQDVRPAHVQFCCSATVHYLRKLAGNVSTNGLWLSVGRAPRGITPGHRDGDFSVGIRDADFQVIPTAWVLAAEARWKPDGAHGLSMTAMALDPAGGGRDSAELARRHGGWYAELISAKGQEPQTAPRRRQWLCAIAWTVRL
jgi:hypothetical protein